MAGSLSRMRGAISVASDSALAAYMGISPKTISNWKQRNSIPEEYTREFAVKTGVSLDWLVLGRDDAAAGPELANEDSPPYELGGPGDFVLLNHYDAKASAGLGIENGGEKINKKNAFRREWWQRHVALPMDQCFSMDIVGDSMAPRLTEDHIPIIQRLENEMPGDGIYVFRLDGEVYIKYLERRPVSGLIARSENEKYTPWEIGDGSTFGEFKIIGRVIRKMIVELP